MSANINFAAGAATGAVSAAVHTGSSAKKAAATATAAASSSAPAPAGEGKAKSNMILPYEVLFNLVGRRVTVLLTQAGHELEGTLQSVDSDKGDMLLSAVVHYQWMRTQQSAEEASGSGSSSAGADGKKTEGKGGEAKAVEDGFQACVGGGQRRELSRCSQAMVNSTFVALVTPTVFAPA